MVIRTIYCPTARNVILDWVNMRDPIDEDTVEWFWRRYPRVLTPMGRHAKVFVPNVRRLLREAWESEDIKDREWFLMESRILYARACAAGDFFGPRFAEKTFPSRPKGERAAMDDAFIHAQKAVSEMMICRRDCDTRYFFRTPERRWYCSQACYLDYRREYKAAHR